MVRTTGIKCGVAAARSVKGGCSLPTLSVPTASIIATPLMGPDVAVSYNHLDGLRTGLGEGWRTNYDMKLYDNSYDRMGNGIVPLGFRQAGDLLTLIDETGRRELFRYGVSGFKFSSDKKTGMTGATITPTDYDENWDVVLKDSDGNRITTNCSATTTICTISIDPAGWSASRTCAATR
jgi:hypothetical protein